MTLDLSLVFVCYKAFTIVRRYVCLWLYLLYNLYFIFFFKQKTAYEMRISDWSSDVCSSDLCLLSIGVTTEIYIPYFLQVIHAKSPLMAGYWTALMSAGWTLGSFISSGRSSATANRLIRTGPVSSTVSLALLAIMLPLGGLSPDSRPQGAWLILPLLGGGLGG